MDVDPIEDKYIRVHFCDAAGSLRKADVPFELAGKTVQDLYDTVKEYFIAEDNETSGKAFILKYDFHLLRLTDKVEDVIKNKYPVFSLEWGTTLVADSQKPIVIS